jgi:predicted RNase H-like nuclease (RuvC/YqgF family)
MPLTESQRNQIASYKIQIERYRADLQRLKDEKKRKSEHYANMIRNAQSSDGKRSYRQTKISTINSLVNQMESKKRDIERLKANIASIKN